MKNGKPYRLSLWDRLKMEWDVTKDNLPAVLMYYTRLYKVLRWWKKAKKWFRDLGDEGE